MLSLARSLDENHPLTFVHAEAWSCHNLEHEGVTHTHAHTHTHTLAFSRPSKDDTQTHMHALTHSHTHTLTHTQYSLARYKETHSTIHGSESSVKRDEIAASKTRLHLQELCHQFVPVVRESFEETF